MIDPGLQRVPPPAARAMLDRRRQEIQAEVAHNRQLHEARVARWKRSRLRAALLGASPAIKHRP